MGKTSKALGTVSLVCQSEFSIVAERLIKQSILGKTADYLKIKDS